VRYGCDFRFARACDRLALNWTIVPTMTETSNGTEERPAAGRLSSEPSAAPPAPPTAKKNRLSALLEWSKPYRETIAILTAVLVAISGGVSWIVAHFATQAELHYLECRVTNNILTQLLPIHMEEFAGKIDWRAAQIKQLAQNGGGTNGSISTIFELTDQINTLTKEQKDASAKLQKDIDATAKQCINEAPQIRSKT
jgi:hypothetical protein